MSSAPPEKNPHYQSVIFPDGSVLKSAKTVDDFHIRKKLRVDKESTFNDDVTIKGSLIIQPNYYVDGGTYFEIDHEGNVSGVNNITIENNATIGGDLIVNNNTTIGGNLTLEGNEVIEGNLTINGDTNFNGDTYFHGDTNFDGTIHVSSATIDNMIVNNDLEVGGDVYCNYLRSNTSVRAEGGLLYGATGVTTLGNVTMNGTSATTNRIVQGIISADTTTNNTNTLKGTRFVHTSGAGTGQINPIVQLNDTSYGAGVLNFHTNLSAGSYNSMVTANSRALMSVLTSTGTDNMFFSQYGASGNHGIQLSLTSSFPSSSSSYFTRILAASNYLKVEPTAITSFINTGGTIITHKLDSTGFSVNSNGSYIKIDNTPGIAMQSNFYNLYQGLNTPLSITNTRITLVAGTNNLSAINLDLQNQSCILGSNTVYMSMYSDTSTCIVYAPTTQFTCPTNFYLVSSSNSITVDPTGINLDGVKSITLTGGKTIDSDFGTTIRQVAASGAVTNTVLKSLVTGVTVGAGRYIVTYCISFLTNTTTTLAGGDGNISTSSTGYTLDGVCRFVPRTSMPALTAFEVHGSRVLRPTSTMTIYLVTTLYFSGASTIDIDTIHSFIEVTKI